MNGLKKIGELDLNEKRSLVDPKNTKLSQREQCKLLGLCRAGLYYEPRPLTEETLELMRAIDEKYLQHPFYGRRRMTIAMREQGFFVGEKRVRTAMQTMGLEVIYPKPNLSGANKEHKKFPYLLRRMEIMYPNHVWSGDITYVLLIGGFGYLFAIYDSLKAVRNGLRDYFKFHNEKRPHQGLGYRTPAEVYFEN